MLGGEFTALLVRPRKHFQIKQAQHRAFGQQMQERRWPFCDACARRRVAAQLTPAIAREPRARVGKDAQNGQITGFQLRLHQQCPAFQSSRSRTCRLYPARQPLPCPGERFEHAAARSARSSGCTRAVTEWSQPAASRQAMLDHAGPDRCRRDRCQSVQPSDRVLGRGEQSEQ